MSDHEHTATVAADPEELYRYLSDVGNLPHYFSAMRSAETVTDDAHHTEVHTVAEVEGVRREGEAWFDTDDDARSIRWGAEGSSGYRGELAVAGSEGAATVTVRLHTEHLDDSPDVREKVDQGLRETVDTIRRNVEQDADPAAPPAR